MNDSKRYVAGFLLNHDRTEVVLVRKNRPEWQAGYLNGIGGKIEPGETSVDAMSREFVEETGLFVPAEKWDLMCTIMWPDDNVRVGNPMSAQVDFYRSVWPEEKSLSGLVKSCTDERIEVWGTRTTPMQVIESLRWLLPLACYTADLYEPFTVHATTSIG